MTTARAAPFPTASARHPAAPGGAFLLSPKISYTEGIGPSLARSPTTKTGGHTHRAAAVPPLAACSPRRVVPDHTAPPLGPKHNPHKRC